MQHSWIFRAVSLNYSSTYYAINRYNFNFFFNHAGWRWITCVQHFSFFFSMTFSFHYSNLDYILRKRGWYWLVFIIIIIIFFLRKWSQSPKTRNVMKRLSTGFTCVEYHQNEATLISEYKSRGSLQSLLFYFLWFGKVKVFDLHSKYQLLSKICHCCGNTKVSSLSGYFGQVNHLVYSDNPRMLSSSSYT